MSIDVNAKLIYGVRYKDLPEEILGEVDEMIDDETLDSASPWYDSERKYWIIGVEFSVSGRDPQNLAESILQIDEEVPEILIRDDIELLMYVTPDVS